MRKKREKGKMRPCLVCGTEVYRTPCQDAVNERVFCKRACYYKWMSSNSGQTTSHWKGGDVLMVCAVCSSEFSISRKQLKKERKYCSKACYGKARAGDQHHNWQGGISTEREQIKQTDEYRQWRLSVFRRDHFKCVACLTKDRLEAHHLKPFSAFPDLRFDVDNGATLCRPCHNQISRIESQFEDFLRGRILRDLTLDTRVPMPLVKVKSDLMGDYERLAEMTSPALRAVTERSTLLSTTGTNSAPTAVSLDRISSPTAPTLRVNLMAPTGRFIHLRKTFSDGLER